MVGKPKVSLASNLVGIRLGLNLHNVFVRLLPFLSFIRTMVKSAISWATQRGLPRKNPVHGAEEYRVATDWSFKNEEKDKTETRVSAAVDVQAGPALGSSVMLLLRFGL